MKIVVLIPTYNERENVEACIVALESEFEKVPDHDFSILISDDNSPDKTAEIVKTLQKKYKNLSLQLNEKKLGLGGAYLAALRIAFDDMRADAIFTLDCDLSHDITKIPLFVKELEKGNDVIIGTRYRRGGGIPESWGLHRKFLSIVGNLFISALYIGSHVTDFTGGYKLMSRKVYEAIRHDISKHAGYTFSISLNIEALRKGFSITEIPFHFTDRTAGTSKMGSEYIYYAFLFVIRSRVEDIMRSRFAKVFISGGIGASAQLASYGILFHPIFETRNLLQLPISTRVFSLLIHPQFFIAQLLSIEIGVLSTFSLNNRWAFKDKQLHGNDFIRAFLKNHLVVAGAIGIQLVTGQLLSALFGVGVFRAYIFQSIGIFLGLFWNFYFYKKVIWKVQK